MKKTRNRLIFFCLILGATLSTSCGSGGPDIPFIFPPGEGQPGEILPPPPECDDTSGCPPGETCEGGSCVVVLPPVCTTDADCEPVPLPAETCNVNFETTLELRADSKADNTDIPSFCTALGGDFDHSDLICCTEQNFSNPGTEPTFASQLICDEIGRLAVTQFKGSKPLKIRFDLSGGNCRVFVTAADVPEYRLENSALEASLIIDGGGNASAPDAIRTSVAAGTCRETADGIAIDLDNPGLQFMIRLYDNWTRCQRASIPSDQERCQISSSFSEWFNTLGAPASSPPPATANALQILPGFANTPFALVTGSRSAAPREGVSGVLAISVSGTALKTDTTSKTRMTLVTAFRMPEEDQNIDFNTGTGPLTGPLNDAVMTATIRGIATDLKNPGATIQSLSDLSANCRSGTTPGDLTLSASIVTPKKDGTLISEPLPVSGNSTDGFVIDICLPGTHNSGSCLFPAPEDLPFAKEDGDPIFPSTSSRFEQRATVTLSIEEGSETGLTLDIPPVTGTTFEIENADLLNDLTIAPLVGTSIDLDLLFAPRVAGAGCSSSGTIVTCDASGPTAVVLSNSPRISLNFSGRARTPSPVMKIDELTLASPDQVKQPLAGGSTLLYGEQVIGVGTSHRLLRVSNEGVRSLQVTRLDLPDLHRNFRLGSILQGGSFAEREWKSDLSSWSVPPTAQSDLFFFVNYGPFARPILAGGATTRDDSSVLILETLELSPTTLFLNGSAKLDFRAELALYLQDETRFTVEGGCAGDCVEIVPGEHLYPARNLLFSLRQDGTPNRAIYLRNDAGLGDSLKIRSRPGFSFANSATQDRFAVTYETDPDPFDVTLPPQQSVKIGTVTFNPNPAASYQVFEATLPIDAVSVTASGAESRPKIHGGEPVGSPTTPTFLLKGASGAPDGPRTLILHRLVSGMSSRISEGNQKSRIASTVTRGILERYQGQQGITLTPVEISKYRESFRLPGGIELDPVRGIARMKSIFTPLDPDSNNPRSTQDPMFRGVRFFNAPGSNPARQEYRIQCERAGGHDCAYFYVYLADGKKLGEVPACAAGRAAIASSPASDLSNILNPEDAAQLACLESYLNSLSPITGRYDPVTGEVSFVDVAVRFFAPNVPAVSQADVDSTLRLALTTECVTPDFVPDDAALAGRLVPDATLEDLCPGNVICHDTLLIGGANPLGFYVGDDASCAERELHGRRMRLTNASTGETENSDTTGTFDAGSDPAPGPFNFDLAGMAKIRSSQGQANGILIYIVIKAEVLP